MITTFLQQSLVEGDAPHAFWVLASSGGLIDKGYLHACAQKLLGDDFGECIESQLRL
jgi:hypothetical protein